MKVRWVAWSIVKPYMHVFCIDLTGRQHDKFMRLLNYESMTEAYEYARKVGKKL